MIDTHLADLDVLEAAEALHLKRISSDELTRACLDRIEQRDPLFGAWLRVYQDAALAAAQEADRRIRAGTSGRLTGVPIGLKDVIGVDGLPLTADSPVLAGNVARVDSTAWARLRKEGMVLLGHLHCGAFACGTWGANPWSPRFSSGGSSSGSGIAVASRTVPVTLGTDGRGSIRIPASMNGVTGHKPTFGLVSTYGCIPITFSYDVVGPMARTAADCALLMRVLVGPDPGDRMTLTQPRDLVWPAVPRAGSRPLAETRIGVPRIRDGLLAEGVATVYARFAGELEALGATLVEFDRPANPLEANGGSGAGWMTVLGAEALAIHAQFAGREHLHRPDFSVLFNPMTQNVGTAVEYVTAQMKRGELIATWEALLSDLALDAVIEPGHTSEIWKVNDAGELQIDLEREVAFYGTWNDTNFPVISVPAGVSPTDGGPVGMQIIGLPYRDPRILQIAIDFQAATGYHAADPPGLSESSPAPYVPPSVPDGGPQPAYVPPHNPFDAVIPLGPSTVEPQ
jgi:aspartyl-tRNA(Asn)/glutamyl-tRNA(Gln) amidotransferase subunit A